MKKRVMALICAAMLVGSMSLTALAAPSKEAGIVTGIDKVVDKNGKELTTGVDVVVQSVVTITDDTQKKAAADIKEEANLKKELEKLNAYETGMKVMDVRDAVVDGDKSLIDWPIDITFKVNGVKAGDKVVCLHWKDNAWEKLETVTGEGIVTVKGFTSLSPVAFIKVDTGSTTSPTTGEPIMVVWAIAAIVAGAAGIAYTSKKRA